MRWYKDEPDEGDFVVVTLTDVDKNSAYADLDEYPDKTGLIHISEASRSWVQDMRKEISEGEKTVAQVVEVEDGNISLSLKRVNEKQKRDSMERWNKERKAEGFMEQLGEELGMDTDETYEEIGFEMQREFGSSFHGFEISVAEEDRLEELFDEEVVDAIQKIARENIDLKQEKLEGELEINFSQGDGIERIKEALEDTSEGVEIKYMSAPRYSVTAWGRTQKLAKKRMDSTVEHLREKVQELGGEFEFKKA
ncbi:MAG: S1 RNA-binding domain-containing protein [Candidatus Nanohaloarchaea archaeon]